MNPVCHVANPLKTCPGCGVLYVATEPRPCIAPYFCDDLERFHESFRNSGVLIMIETDDGPEPFIDSSKVHPDLMSAYRGLLSYGYANGLIEINDAGVVIS